MALIIAQMIDLITACFNIDYIAADIRPLRLAVSSKRDNAPADEYTYLMIRAADMVYTCYLLGDSSVLLHAPCDS